MKTAILVFALVLSGCAQAASPAASIQSDLEHDPSIKDKGYTVSVVSFDHGYLTLSVKGFREKSVAYLNKGETLSDVIMHGEWNARVLAQAEAMLKKRADVKGVKWVPAK